QSCPVGVGEEDPQPMKTVAREAKSQKKGADSVEQSRGDLRPHSIEREGKHCRGQRILFQRRVIRILMCGHAPGQVYRPLKVAGILAQSVQQKPAEASGSQADGAREYDTFSHAAIFASTVVTWAV